jgi:hypothetical protein
MTKESYYFSHDYNARTDEKIRLLIRKHGMKGYGIFWSIIEDLYNNANALHLDCEGIAFELREDINVVESIITDFNLFQINDGMFGSISVEKRLEERLIKSNKAREIAHKRWNKPKENANAMPTQSEGNAIKERKGKEKKEVIPTLSEFLDYAKTQKSYNSNLEHAIQIKYESWVANGWVDGYGNKIERWKGKLISTLPHLKPIEKQVKLNWKGEPCE